jgi:hypothetical protein
MNRSVRALAALPLVVSAVTLCGLAMGALGLIFGPLVGRMPLITRWIAIALAAPILGAIADYGFRRLSRKHFGLSDISLVAVRDAILIIAGLACLIGATFLVMSLFPSLALQAWPLRATGTVLVAGGLVLFLFRFRGRTARPGPKEPPPQSNAGVMDRRGHQLHAERGAAPR